jgi:hypothetical protein
MNLNRSRHFQLPPHCRLDGRRARKFENGVVIFTDVDLACSDTGGDVRAVRGIWAAATALPPPLLPKLVLSTAALLFVIGLIRLIWLRNIYFLTENP